MLRHSSSRAVSVQILIAMFLALLGTYYLAVGFYIVMTKPYWKCDLELLWNFKQVFLSGFNPYTDAGYFAHPGSPASRLLMSELTARHVNLDRVGPMSYPPWYFMTASLFLPWMSYPATRLWYGCVNALALVVIGGWSYRQFPKPRIPWALPAVITMCAMSSNGWALIMGQSGIIVLGALVLSVVAARNGMQIVEGLLLAIAASKPQVAGLFYLIPLFQRRWTALTVCGATLGVSVWLFAWTFGQGPMDVMRQFADNVAGYHNAGEMWIEAMPAFLAKLPASTECFSLVTVALCALVIFKFRRADQADLCAVAGWFGRLWTYHRPYDDVMLMFLLLALGKRWAAGNRIAGWAFGAMVISMMFPIYDWSFSQNAVVAKDLCWGVGLWVVLRDITAGDTAPGNTVGGTAELTGAMAEQK